LALTSRSDLTPRRGSNGRRYGGVCLLLVAVGLFFREVTVGGGDARFFERAPTVLLGVWQVAYAGRKIAAVPGGQIVGVNASVPVSP
jgi:hypothetical protein